MISFFHLKVSLSRNLIHNLKIFKAIKINRKFEEFQSEFVKKSV